MHTFNHKIIPFITHIQGSKTHGLKKKQPS